MHHISGPFVQGNSNNLFQCDIFCRMYGYHSEKIFAVQFIGFSDKNTYLPDDFLNVTVLPESRVHRGQQP